MTLDITFALLREGTSDDGLIPHLQTLLVREGATSAVGTGRPYSGPVEAKLSKLQKEEARVDIVFVHWDADARSGEERRQRVLTAASSITPPQRCVPVVPVQELEAWLLADPGALRTAVGRPSATDWLEVPRVRDIENTTSPKEILAAALLDASATTGRKRDKERRKFAQRRRTLLERLDIDGPVSNLPSFQQLVADVAAAVEEMHAA